jgi:hypothetical protein
MGKSITNKSTYSKRYKGGADMGAIAGTQPEKKTFSEKYPFISGIITVVFFIIKCLFGLLLFIVLLFILFACAAVMALFVGSYIMLEYFLKAINYVFVGGINGIIKFVMSLVVAFSPDKKKAKKMKKNAKLKKIPTDPSVLVLRALGIKPLRDDPDKKKNEENNEEDEECSEDDE